MIRQRTTNTGLLVCLALLALAFSTDSAHAFTPKSPEVQKLVKRGVRYLSKSDTYSDHQRVLAAIALMKAGEPKSHPLVDQARGDCIEWTGSASMVEGSLDSIYKLSVVGLFFCEYDPVAYRDPIRRLITSLEKRQKTFGGWGYPESSSDWKTGDTSMTQYAILFAWTARATGAAELSTASIRKATNWLLRTQDVTGAWGYQGNDPGRFRRVKQTEIRRSLAAAGIGSLYICSGMLGLTNDQIMVAATDDLPPALRPVVVQESPTVARVPDDVIDRKTLRAGIRDGDRWFSQHYRIQAPEYPMYYLYMLERYQSFRDAAEGRSKKEPGWYNDGVRLLKQQQKRDGSWNMGGGNGRLVDTAFSILFLVRSTQKSIAKMDEQFAGLLIAGRGLPSSTKNMKMEKGQIVRSPFQGSTSLLLEILENESHPEFDSLASLSSVPLAKNPKALSIQQKKMQRLVRAESFPVRLLAVKTLAKIHDLENVPFLIYALTDPDVRVVIAARDGLRFIGRKFGGFGLPDEPSKAERERAVGEWKAWYLDIRPHASFED